MQSFGLYKESATYDGLNWAKFYHTNYWIFNNKYVNLLKLVFSHYLDKDTELWLLIKIHLKCMNENAAQKPTQNEYNRWFPYQSRKTFYRSINYLIKIMFCVFSSKLYYY